MAGDLNCKHFNGKLLRLYADGAMATVIGPAQPYYPARANARPDVLDVAAVKSICCPVTVSSMAELSSDHCPIGVHVGIQHPIVCDERRIIEWDRFGPALCRWFPEQVPLDTTQHFHEAPALFDKAVFTAMNWQPV